MITVYTSPQCQPCKLVKKMLKSYPGLQWKEKPLAMEPELIEEATARGMISAPIVIDEETGEWVSGFRPEVLKVIIARNLATTTPGGVRV